MKVMMHSFVNLLFGLELITQQKIVREKTIKAELKSQVPFKPI
jgi:hypothetical protein